MATNYVLISEQTLNASAASVTFSSIPQTGYTDLVLKVSVRCDYAANATDLWINFNGTASALSTKLLYGTGSTAASALESSKTNVWSMNVSGTSATSNTFINGEYYIPNYTSSAYKSFSADSVTENNGTTALAMLTAGLYSNTSAITSITITPAGGNLIAGSTVSLYGIAAVGTTPTVVPKASGGDVITNDGTYWIHQFYSSGVFTPNTNLTCDYLVVAGGGGGGYNIGGGGGAGGFRTSSTSLTGNTSFTITVGAGGAGAVNHTHASNGSNSSLNTISSTGGGGGGSRDVGSPYQPNGNNGGSGGGASNSDQGTASPGSGNAGGYSPVEGYAGGSSAANSGPNYPAGGGGGSSAVGQTPASTSANGGNGGAGTASSITGSSVTYAGGGGGGANVTAGTGSAGGGNGNASGAGGVATVNTGSGGGGGSNGGNGGSGIVIIRYAMA